MSAEYDRYLEEHLANVKKGFYWIRKSLPELLIELPNVDYELMILLHDDTKTVPSEYEPYDEYFYGKHKKDTLQKFRYAWLEHIHRNPHHWQHWILRNDDEKGYWKYLYKYHFWCVFYYHYAIKHTCITFFYFICISWHYFIIAGCWYYIWI